MSLIIYNKEYFLTEEFSFTKQISEAVLVNIEYISGKNHTSIYNIRIKINSSYICIENNNISLIDEKNDNTIFIKMKNKLLCNFGYLVCNSNYKLDLESEGEEMYDFNRMEIISSGYFLDFLKEGIMCLNSSYNLETVSKIIHESHHTRISNLFELDKNLFWKILNDPIIHIELNKIFPSGYHCTTYSSNNIRKGTDERGWHCDYPYHDISQPYPKETLGVQVIWTLDDFTVDNGATFYVPGSHKNLSWPNKLQKNYKRAICKKGKIIIFFGKLWHSQGINKTNNPRAALLANFSPLNIIAKDDLYKYVDKEFVKDNKVIF
tara:strand:- start:2004 stop:2966 length:963 start_codon:yes stop_codon:yes gene_type:complete